MHSKTVILLQLCVFYICYGVACILPVKTSLRAGVMNGNKMSQQVNGVNTLQSHMIRASILIIINI